VACAGCMDVNAAEFVPGSLSANAVEYVPLAARRLLSPNLGMSSQAAEFVPGKLQGIGPVGGMPHFPMNYDVGNAAVAGASGGSNVRGLPSAQQVPGGGFLDGVSGTGALVDPGSFHDNKEWAPWNKDVNSGDLDGNWDPEDGGKWDATGPRWEPEDGASKALHLPQARAGHFTGSKISSVQYMDHHGRIDQEDFSANPNDGLHRPENLLDNLMVSQHHAAHIEARDSTDAAWDVTARRAAHAEGAIGDGAREVLGTKVALDVLFPNMERGPDDDLPRSQTGAAAARLPAVASDDFRGWASGSQNHNHSHRLFDHSPGQEALASLGEDSSLNIAESVAAAALGFDMDDDPMERLDMDDQAGMCMGYGPEPSSSSQSLAFPPPPAPSMALNGMVSLHDVLPMQDALWQPPPRISAAQAGKLQGIPGAHGQLPAALPALREPPVELNAEKPGARHNRLLPPPPPSEPPPPPPPS